MKNDATGSAKNWLLLFLTAFLFMQGCASPEQEEKKAFAEQAKWRQMLAPYSDEQLDFRLRGLEQAIERGTDGMNILLADGNGLGVLVAQREIEKKVKERDGVGSELARRRSAAEKQFVPSKPEDIISNAPSSGSTPPVAGDDSSKPWKMFQKKVAPPQFDPSQPYTVVPSGNATASAPRPPIVHYSGGGGHWIESVMDDGEIIKLEDGSLWKVDPYDTFDSAVWITLDDITVVEGDDPEYSYKLINTDENEIVHAKRLQ